MRVLLDPRTFLWFITADASLSPRVSSVIREWGTDALRGVASVWEISIRPGLRKLPIPVPVDRFIRMHLEENRIELLPIELSHAADVAALRMHHGGPFDRLLVAQALAEQCL